MKRLKCEWINSMETTLLVKDGASIVIRLI